MKRDGTRFRPARDQKQQGTEEKDQSNVPLAWWEAGVSSRKKSHSLCKVLWAPSGYKTSPGALSHNAFSWIPRHSAAFPSPGHSPSSKPSAHLHGSHPSLQGLSGCGPSRLDHAPGLGGRGISPEEPLEGGGCHFSFWGIFKKWWWIKTALGKNDTGHPVPVSHQMWNKRKS